MSSGQVIGRSSSCRIDMRDRVRRSRARRRHATTCSRAHATASLSRARQHGRRGRQEKITLWMLTELMTLPVLTKGRSATRCRGLRLLTMPLTCVDCAATARPLCFRYFGCRPLNRAQSGARRSVCRESARVSAIGSIGDRDASSEVRRAEDNTRGSCRPRRIGSPAQARWAKGRRKRGNARPSS